MAKNTPAYIGVTRPEGLEAVKTLIVGADETVDSTQLPETVRNAAGVFAYVGTPGGHVAKMSVHAHRDIDPDTPERTVCLRFPWQFAFRDPLATFRTGQFEIEGNTYTGKPGTLYNGATVEVSRKGRKVELKAYGANEPAFENAAAAMAIAVLKGAYGTNRCLLG